VQYKQSTNNVYKTDSSRSVRVRSMGQCQFSHFHFNSRGDGLGGEGGENMTEGEMSYTHSDNKWLVRTVLHEHAAAAAAGKGGEATISG